MSDQKNKYDDILKFLIKAQQEKTLEAAELYLDWVHKQDELSVKRDEMSLNRGLELFKSVISYGQFTLKASLLINGGAAVSVLAFIGHLATEKSGSHYVALFAVPMLCWCIGVLSAVLSIAMTYIAQRCYSADTDKGRKFADRLTLGICGSAGFSFFVFFWGCWESYLNFLLIS